MTKTQNTKQINENKNVSNLGHLDFDIVSNFEFRISSLNIISW